MYKTFSHLPPVSLTPVVHLEMRNLREFRIKLNADNGIIGS
jgi:hypothetical protein